MTLRTFVRIWIWVAVLQLVLTPLLMAIPALERELLPAAHKPLGAAVIRLLVFIELPIPAVLISLVVIRFFRWRDPTGTGEIKINMILFGANASAYALSGMMYYAIHALDVHELEAWLWFPAISISAGYGIHLWMIWTHRPKSRRPTQRIRGEKQHIIVAPPKVGDNTTSRGLSGLPEGPGHAIG
jgi:hypothetical protein